MAFGKQNTIRRASAAVIAVATGSIAPPQAGAATIQWNGNAADLSWNTPGNWSTGAPPGAADIGQIQENGYGGGDTIAVTGDITIGRLAVNYSTSNSAGKGLNASG